MQLLALSEHRWPLVPALAGKADAANARDFIGLIHLEPRNNFTHTPKRGGVVRYDRLQRV